MNNEMKGAKPTLAERLYEMSKEDSVYCTLEKYDNPDDESVEAAYKELIECYDIASIVKYAKETVAVNGKVFGKDIAAFSRLRKMYGLHSRKATL